MLQASGKPYIIENVPGAPLLNHVQVCGSYFDLRVTKERWFESNVNIAGTPCVHKGRVKRRNLDTDEDGYYWRCYGHERNCGLWIPAMGIDWPMTREEAANAIPPAFTEYIGRQIIDYLESTR
jgi:DNA (cytosine-5)-methyltransferase 1